MPEETQKLTVNDPISPEILAQFNELEDSHYKVANHLLSIEQERIRLLSAAHQVDLQRQRLFEKVLMERGLAPTTQVEIDSKTGTLKLLEKAP